MKITRREALKLAAGSAAARLAGQTKAPRGPFQPTWESLQQYRCPEWFRDAKLGFWAHWGPQGGPKQGDWCPQHLYSRLAPEQMPRRTFRAPSKVGYKDVVPLWTARGSLKR